MNILRITVIFAVHPRLPLQLNLLLSSRPMWHFKVVATWRIRAQNALKNTTLHVKEIMQLITWILIPSLKDLLLKLIQVEFAHAR